MAEISKLSGVAIADVAKVDAILKASIANINDLTIPSAFTGLLDTYSGAVCAFSVRRLYSLYTGACMRIREDSGDTETDIGFDSNGDLDTAAIASHCGSANGYVVTWYGQEASGGTGSGNDIAQGTVTLQALIYDGSAVTTANGIAALTLNNDRLGQAATSSFNLNDFGVYTVNQASATPNTYQASVSLGVNASQQAVLNYRTVQQEYLGTLYGTVSTNTAYNLSSMYADNTDSEVKGYFNTTEITSTTPSSQSVSAVQVGHIRNISSTHFRGTIQEVVTFGSSTKDDHTGIQGNVNAHFQIGNFGTPTSGLLYDYSGAAAAYSVRQLANTAALAMRIREDGTDTETDIGFDSNGDLDTAAISSHCGSNNGYVVTWYDQSGNQVDATQGTSGSQPQIYNGTAVITENGKPSIEFDDVSLNNLTLSVTGTVANATGVLVRTAAGMPSSHEGTAFNYKTFGITYGHETNSGYRNAVVFRNTRALQLNTYPTTDEQALDFFVATEISAGSTDSDVSIYRNGTAGNSGQTNRGYGAGSNLIGAWDTQYFRGGIQELLIWESDQSSNRTGIETDINDYFSIYT